MKLMNYLGILFLTLLVIYDFFPHILVVSWLSSINLSVTLIILLIMALLLQKNQNGKGETKNFYVYFMPHFYLIFLIGILTLFGGESQSGLLNWYSIGIFACFLLMDIYQFMKVKKEKRLSNDHFI